MESKLLSDNMKKITKFIWYKGKGRLVKNISIIQIDYVKDIEVNMSKKDMITLANELDVPFEIRKRR